MHADEIADILVDMSIYDNIETFLPTLKDQDSIEILEFAYNFSSLHINANNITNSVKRMTKIIFALKSYVHYEHLDKKTEADIQESIETVLTLYSHQLKHNITVIKNYQEVRPILCYPDELNQVWTNLIHNAIYSMDNNGTLTITLYQQEDYLIIKISDSGKGIPPDIKNKIFEPFFTTKPRGEGSGLGLNIVKKIIDKHHGKIEVESVPGETTFIVSLPMNSLEPPGK
jgi:signal transduction histidine kinase